MYTSMASLSMRKQRAKLCVANIIRSCVFNGFLCKRNYVSPQSNFQCSRSASKGSTQNYPHYFRFFSVSSHFLQLRKPKKEVNTDVFQTVYDVNTGNYKPLKEKYEDLVRRAHEGGGERGIHRHVQRNKKILVRERIKHIVDPDSPFLEIGTIAGHDMSYGNVPCAGAVVGIGKVHGVWCMIFANDATVKSGSIYPITIKKQLRGQLIAEENFLPTIYLVDSAGAFLPLQADIFNIGGRTFYNEAVMSSKGIPQIALVCGSCTAGGAYVPTMAEEAVIVDKIGTIFLGGPPLVRAATGEDVTPEELGGATLHCSISGCTDHFVEDEHEGFQVVRDIIATSNVQGIDTKPFEREEKSEMGKFVSASAEYAVPVYDIIEHLADDGGFHEYKKRYGSTLVTGFMFVNDHLVGVVANNGYLSDSAANKGSNFLQLCGVRQIPVLFLQNITHDECDQSPSLQTADVIKNRAKLLQAIVLCQSPKVVISVGGLVGSPHMHPMCSLSMGARFHFVWPNVTIASSFLHNLNEAGPPRDAKSTQDDYSKLRKTSSAFYGASQLWYDGVIMPEDTRELLYFCLNIFKQDKEARLKTSKKSLLANELNTVIRM